MEGVRRRHHLPLQPAQRRDVRDGTTITSSDAVWSLQQIITKKYVGSDELSALSNVESDGNSTLVLRLREPDPRLLAKLTTRIGIVYNQRENIDYAKQASGPDRSPSPNGNPASS